MALLRLSRRELLLAGLGGGAMLAVGVYGGWRLARRAERRRRIVPPREQPFAPGPFVAIDETGLTSVWLSKVDIGQGVATALPMVVAEELGADPARLRVLQANADDAYGNQMVGVSASVRGMFKDLRAAGAAAREMLVSAAADAFGAPARECRVEQGFVVHPASGRRLPFGALVRAAARKPVPESPMLKASADWRFIGKSMPRLDLPAKIDGSARFGVDVRIAGMAFAVLARCPTPGGRALRFEAAAARAVPGVRDVVAIDRGIAVLADNTHAAMVGRAALRVEWDLGPHTQWDDAAITAHLNEKLALDGVIARRAGNGAEGLRGTGRLVSAEYRLPYLAHAAMEPLSCTADVRSDGCAVWAAVQSPAGIRDAVARRLGIGASHVAVHLPLGGGAFGRRIADDFVLEAVDVAKAAGRPVHVLWTREDDLQHDWYRPCSVHRLEARLDPGGLPLAWHHRIVAPSILAAHGAGQGEVDPTAVEGAVDLPYGVRDLQVEYARAELPMRIGFWRSVGNSYNAFAVECFIDELAVAAGRDPVALRRALLARQPRHLAALERAVVAAGTPPMGPGRGRGVAVHGCYGSFVAMVADVTAKHARSVTIDRIVCAADCGLAVHPDGVAAQIEGGIAFALSAVLHGKVPFRKGAAALSNFDDYPLLRMDEMPRVEVHLIDGAPEDLGGVGEIGVPPVAPAVCNAVRSATGRPVRALPLYREDKN